MNILAKGAAKRLIFSLFLAASLGGCVVYDAPYAGYGPYPYGYAGPAYVGPPVSLDLGFDFYDNGRGYERGGYHGRHDHGRGGQHWRR